MKPRQRVWENQGEWGDIRVYPDYVHLRPSLRWAKSQRAAIRRSLRRNLRQKDIEAMSVVIQRRLIALATRGKWTVSRTLLDGHISVVTDYGVRHSIAPSSEWAIDAKVMWLERKLDSREPHFGLREVFEAQALYEINEILALKLLAVDLLALDRPKWAEVLAKSTSSAVVSSTAMCPMDAFCFWMDGKGNIFAHTAFGEPVRLLYSLDPKLQKREEGPILWKDILKKTRDKTKKNLQMWFL